jgi:glycosyltransferase involved in cell wall biosynthesis
VIAGEGRYDVKAETEKRLLENNVLILKQFTAEQDIGALFCGAIVVILPYLDGSQSGVIPLAYTFGKPVIASRVGSLSEMVDEQKTGFTFDPNNALELARCMGYFLEDKQLSERMRVFCSKKSETSLSPSLIAAKIFEAYRQIRETE